MNDGFAPITVPTHALPYANETPTDGQFVGRGGEPIPFVDPTGPFETTTTDQIVAGQTVRVNVAAPGIQVGDWLTLTNGSQEAEPREVIAATAAHVTVDRPFDISATGTSTLSTKKITPKLNWVVPGGQDFGDLSWNASTQTLTGMVTVHSTTSSFKEAFITVQIGDASTNQGMAQKTQKLTPRSGVTCKRLKEAFEYPMTFSMTGPSNSLKGKSVQLIGLAHFYYKKECNIRGIAVGLGPRQSPVFTIPS